MANQIQIAAISNIGCVRENNEDNLFVCDRFMKQGEPGGFQLSDTVAASGLVCAVFDGMGGEKGGETASLEAVNRFRDRVNTPHFTEMTLPEKISEINQYVEETNTAIFQLAAGSSECKGMGTTFACLITAQNQAVAMHVGDSRVYLYRAGALQQLTRDHSENERLIRLGIITREQARGHKSRFMLTRHLGMPPEEGILEADVSDTIQLQKGDTFLLCTDGLTDMVEDPDIKNILASSTDVDQSAKLLVNEALKNGGKDNVTAILLRVNGVCPFH
jgi:protein phosphatase